MSDPAPPDAPLADRLLAGDAPQPRRLANWFERAIALAIDSVLTALPVIAIASVLEVNGLLAAPGVPIASRVAGEILLSAAAAAILWPYHAWQLRSTHQATLGKRLLGLLVTDEDGNRPDESQVGRRVGLEYLAPLLLTLPFDIGEAITGSLAWTGISVTLNLPVVAGFYLLPLFSPTAQGWHDRYAGTLVMKR